MMLLVSVHLVFICRHLTKLFDSIARLKLEGIDSTNANTAIGMHAKDGEYITFSDATSCQGPVLTLCLLLFN